MPRKAAAGAGSIRKKTVTRNGKEYTYWEARYTEGYDPGTGKQIQRSITGKTQKEVAGKLRAATSSIDSGTYTAPSKMTVGQWLDIWEAEYLGSVKETTAKSYRDQIKNHLKPALGAIRLEALNVHNIQSMYNALCEPQNGGAGLSPKTVHKIHGVLHKALKQAVVIGYIRFNPADACTLPRVEHKELKPLDERESRDFLQAIKGHRFEVLFTVALFTGMRQGDDDDKIRLNQRKPSKYKGLSRFGPEKNLQRINKFMKERPIFYKNLIQMKENFRFYLRCFYCIAKVVILQFNSEKQGRISS